MPSPLIGTLIRCAAVDERRIAYYKEIGLNVAQIAGVYEDWLAPTREAEKASDAIFELFRKYQIAVPTMFLSFPKQDWSDHSKIGLLPESLRATRMMLSCRQMNWAKRYGIQYVTCHVGFVPEEKDEFYNRFISDIKQLAMFAGANGQKFLFETGTETVASLKQTIEAIGEPNVGINFDPANLLIYGTDTPDKLVDQLSSYIQVIHCKDANPPEPGTDRGKETVLGAGSTHFDVLLKRLQNNGFHGPLIIERELPLGPEQERDIAEAVKYIKSILQGA